MKLRLQDKRDKISFVLAVGIIGYWCVAFLIGRSRLLLAIGLIALAIYLVTFTIVLPKKSSRATNQDSDEGES